MTYFAMAFDGWEYTQEADRRFNRIMRMVGVPFLIIALAIPFLKFAGLQEGGGDTIENRYITLAPEAEQAPKVEEPKPEKEEAKKPEEKKEQQTKVEKPAEPTEEQKQQAARMVAQKSGVLAMSDQLAALRDNSTLSGYDANRPLASDMVMAKSGTGASGGSSSAFADAATRQSGGITSSSGSSYQRRAQNGTGLDQRRTTVVQSPIGFGIDKSKPGQSGDKMIAGRTLEEIQLTFDRNKGAFYAIFNRAMRENPNLGAGKIVVSLTIAPNGSVSDCKLVSSTFHDPELEKKVIARVLLLNFGAKDVPAFTYPNYPINFLPS